MDCCLPPLLVAELREFSAAAGRALASSPPDLPGVEAAARRLAFVAVAQSLAIPSTKGCPWISAVGELVGPLMQQAGMPPAPGVPSA